MRNRNPVAMVARRAATGDPPRVFYVYTPQSPDGVSDPPVPLVMGGSKQFGVNIFVTAYYVENLGAGRSEIFERAIGIGRVVNIQENGLIQVRVLREVANQSGLWQRSRVGERPVLAQVMIKPSIDFNDFGMEVRFSE